MSTFSVRNACRSLMRTRCACVSVTTRCCLSLPRSWAPKWWVQCMYMYQHSQCITVWDAVVFGHIMCVKFRMLLYCHCIVIRIFCTHILKMGASYGICTSLVHNYQYCRLSLLDDSAMYLFLLWRSTHSSRILTVRTSCRSSLSTTIWSRKSV